MNKKNKKENYRKLQIIFKQGRNKEKQQVNIIKYKIFKIKFYNLINFKIHLKNIKNHNGNIIRKRINIVLIKIIKIFIKNIMMMKKIKKDQILKEFKNYLSPIIIVIKAIIDLFIIFYLFINLHFLKSQLIMMLNGPSKYIFILFLIFYHKF